MKERKKNGCWTGKEDEKKKEGKPNRRKEQHKKTTP